MNSLNTHVPNGTTGNPHHRWTRGVSVPLEHFFHKPLHGKYYTIVIYIKAFPNSCSNGTRPALVRVCAIETVQVLFGHPATRRINCDLADRHCTRQPMRKPILALSTDQNPWCTLELQFEQVEAARQVLACLSRFSLGDPALSLDGDLIHLDYRPASAAAVAVAVHPDGAVTIGVLLGPEERTTSIPPGQLEAWCQTAKALGAIPPPATFGTRQMD